MPCKYDLDKIQQENRNKEQIYSLKIIETLMNQTKAQKLEIDELKTNNRILKDKLTNVDRTKVVEKAEETNIKDLFKQMHIDTKKLEESFVESYSKVNKITKAKLPNDIQSKRIEELERELKEKNRKADKDEIILYKASINKKEEIIKNQSKEIEEYKKKIVELQNVVDQYVKSSLLQPDESFGINGMEKSMLSTYIKTPLQKRRRVENKKINLSELFDVAGLERQKQEKNNIFALENTVKSKKTGANRDVKKVKTILAKENKSFFQDISFDQSSPQFNKKF